MSIILSIAPQTKSSGFESQYQNLLNFRLVPSVSLLFIVRHGNSRRERWLPDRGRMNKIMMTDDGVRAEECKISGQEFLLCARGTMTTTRFTDGLQYNYNIIYSARLRTSTSAARIVNQHCLIL